MMGQTSPQIPRSKKYALYLKSSVWNKIYIFSRNSNPLTGILVNFLNSFKFMAPDSHQRLINETWNQNRFIVSRISLESKLYSNFRQQIITISHPKPYHDKLQRYLTPDCFSSSGSWLYQTSGFSAWAVMVQKVIFVFWNLHTFVFYMHHRGQYFS